MRIVIVSDTHENHDALGVLEGDVLIHCGDGQQQMGTDQAVVNALDDWFGRQGFSRILAIGGNHDFALQERIQAGVRPFENAEYLQNSGVSIDGRFFWGAPWTPKLPGWAFYADQGAIRAQWAKIPTHTDVLITHTPPEGILDVSSAGIGLGCEELLPVVKALAPALHCFGHVHNGAGTEVRGKTTFLNAACSSRQGFRAERVFDL